MTELVGAHSNPPTDNPLLMYDQFIQQAYIDPIRTVIVVDDEFPSLDGLIAKELKADRPWAGREEDAKRIREILHFCRTKPRPWLVDVHDGREVSIAGEDRIAPYLHHSDLMILDYHLSGDAGTGDHAIKILRDLAMNAHFNMVIIYTKGDEQSIETVFRQVAISLSSFDPSLELEGHPKKLVEAALSEMEMENPDIIEQLVNIISDKTYLQIRDNGAARTLLSMPEWGLAKDVLKEYPDTAKINDALWARWLVTKKQEQLSPQLSTADLGKVSSEYSNAFNWIRTDTLFVTVVSKSHKPDEFPSKLLTAIRNWCPSPHQLLMAKMRAQMDERGVLAESGVLRDHFLQAGWTQQLFSNPDIDKKHTLKNTVDRHWEALGDKLRADIDTFAGELASHLIELGEEEVFKKFVRVNWKEHQSAILKRLNTYANLRTTFEHSHLMTGHLLMLGKNELWACLSPACDLVPGQKKSGWHGRLGGEMPFLAVLLHKVNDHTALTLANQNIFVFRSEENGDSECYSFCPSGEVQSNPHWEQMFALRGGRFSDESGTISLRRIAHGNSGIEFQVVQARVIGQLRYEYALNLLQRLGTNLSRVGLDFHVHPLE